MLEDRKLRVFLCHSSNDKPAVRELYQQLKAEGWIDPWLDEEKLYPGQDWDLEIEKAVEATDAVLVFLSNNSVTKEGYIQRELRFVLRIADFKPEGTVFVIPVRLDDCPMPRRLSMWQYVDYFPEDRKDWAYQRLLGSLKVRAKTRGTFGANKKSIARPEKLMFGEIEFIYVPKGKFTMGNGDRQHEVDISYNYLLARYEITNAQFAKFVKESGFKDKWGSDDWKKKLKHPVVNVSWSAVKKYCEWLNQDYSKELPANWLFRLPTEAEWEKAARGTDKREWPWGNKFDINYCNGSEEVEYDSFFNLLLGLLKTVNSDTTPVGLYSPQGDSPYGAGDMAGNVDEWTHSEYKDYPYDLNDGRENENSTALRVVRGGSCQSNPNGLKTTSRTNRSPTNASKLMGFRVALAPKVF